MAKIINSISNGEYTIGCTGQTVYVYDKNGVELAKFKDLIYAYNAAISPRGDIFVVKTAEGRLGVYSLERLELIKKFRFSKVDGAQDDNFCFSPDGKEFYNIERHIDSCKTALSIYETEGFSLKKRLFDTDYNLVLEEIEWDSRENMIYLSGFFRDEKSGVASKCFIGQMIDDELKNIRYIPKRSHFMRQIKNAFEKSGSAGFLTDALLSNLPGNVKDEPKDLNESLPSRWKQCKGE